MQNESQILQQYNIQVIEILKYINITHIFIYLRLLDDLGSSIVRLDPAPAPA